MLCSRAQLVTILARVFTKALQTLPGHGCKCPRTCDRRNFECKWCQMDPMQRCSCSEDFPPREVILSAHPSNHNKLCISCVSRSTLSRIMRPPLFLFLIRQSGISSRKPVQSYASITCLHLISPFLLCHKPLNARR